MPARSRSAACWRMRGWTRAYSSSQNMEWFVKFIALSVRRSLGSCQETLGGAFASAQKNLGTVPRGGNRVTADAQLNRSTPTRPVSTTVINPGAARLGQVVVTICGSGTVRRHVRGRRLQSSGRDRWTPAVKSTRKSFNCSRYDHRWYENFIR